MEYCCPLCASTSDSLSHCEFCGIIRNEVCYPTKEKSEGSFWHVILMLIGFGMLMQISALFL